MRTEHESKKHGSSHSRDLDDVLGDLKKSRLKLTEPRKAIIQALVNNHGPFTAEEIQKIITKKICDLATIYRCLTSLEEVGILRRCEFGDGAARYELAETGDSHHHHLICNDCKRIEIVDDCELDEIDRFAKRKGFSDISHTLEFFGTCPHCK